MYGNYPTGYSYTAISISRRPGRDGRAVWEEGKDTAADKKPSLLGWFLFSFFFFKCWLKMWIVWLQACTWVPLSVPFYLRHTYSLRGEWKPEYTCTYARTHTRTHSNKTLIWGKENKIKQGNTGFEKCTLLTAYEGRGTCTYKLKAATLYLN